MTTLAPETFSGRHRATKGIAALVAASALLLSGYGSYALWNDSESLDGGAVSSGELKITDATPGVWRDVSDGGAGTVIPDISAFLTGRRNTCSSASDGNVRSTTVVDLGTRAR